LVKELPLASACKMLYIAPRLVIDPYWTPHWAIPRKPVWRPGVTERNSMANILIDGYNLIGIAHRDFEKARQDLILQLDRYASRKMHSITVVFDGWKNGQAAETKKRLGDVTVIYSSLGEKADSVIKNMLSSAIKPWIVVSSDREVYDFARKKYFVALKADEFAGKLFSALATCEDDKEEILYDDYENGDKDEDFDPQPAGKKGNPNKLSKEDKRKIEALKKL